MACLLADSLGGREVRKSSFLITSGLVAGAVLLMACGSSDKSGVSGNSAPGINVNGQGTAYGVPDIVDVLMGVQVPAPNIAEARQQAATAMEALLRSVKGNGVLDTDVRTSQFSVDPRYVYPPGGPSYA